MIRRYNLGEDGFDRVVVFSEAVVKLLELVLDFFHLVGLCRGNSNLGMLCRQELLVIHKELLVHLFARTQADFFDLDILTRLKAAKRNEVDGKVVDLYRLTHVQNKDLAAMSKRASSNDQLACLGDGHEVTRDVLVRNCDGTALAKLTLKQWDNRSMAPENVAKADGGKDGFAVRRVILNDHFVHTLSGAHYVRGINGLIS